MCSRLLGGGEEPVTAATRMGGRPQTLSYLLCCQGCQTLTMPSGRRDDLHFLPVVRKFSAAIETSYVGSSESGCLRTAGCATNRDGKAVPRVPTTEKRIEQFCDHGAPSTARAGYPAILIYRADY
jgi:hypothetical protein